MDLTREQLLKIIDNLGKKLAQAQLDIAVLEMRVEELSKQQGQSNNQPFLVTKKINNKKGSVKQWLQDCSMTQNVNDQYQMPTHLCLCFTETAEQYVKTVVEPILSPELFDKYFENGGDVIENAELFMKENCEMFIE